jgi:cell division protein FtsZ
VGQTAAEESFREIGAALYGADMVFLTAGMGGGTGTGAAPVFAQLAKEMGILTVAVVTKPFPFELKRRMKIAEDGIRELSEHVDSLITVPNEKLLSVLGRGVALTDAFRSANNVLFGAVQGIAELITRPGLINVDFADVRTVMSEKGRAMMGNGRASGEGRARKAAEAAINCPLLEDINLAGARGILVNVSAGPDLAMDEYAEVGAAINAFASENALVVMGTVLDESLGDELRVTVVATGLDQAAPRAEVPVKLVKTGTRGEVDYKELEKPTVIRNKPVEMRPHALDSDPDYLDIPAFLRRQAD